MLGELFRAARPTTYSTVTAPLSGLEVLGSWQGWPGWESPTWVSETDTVGLAVVGAFLDIAVALAQQMGLHGVGPDGERLEADPLILRNPAPGPNRTLADWVREYLRSSVLRGNYVAVLGDSSWSGWPAVMYPVPNGQWTVEQRADGSIWYTIGATRYPARDVFHVIRNADNGQLVGRGLMDNYPGLIAASVAAERWATRYFEGGAVPPAQIEHPDPDLSQENAEILKAKYRAAAIAHEAVVTPKGTVVNPLASDAEKAQLADTRLRNDQKLAIACGIPGALLGLDSPSLTYRNITDVFQQFLSTTVMGYLEPLEQQLTAFCLPRGIEARFDTAAVLRPDIVARVALAVQAYGTGLVSHNEARGIIDYPPLPDGDTFAPSTSSAPAAGEGGETSDDTPPLEAVA